MWVVSDHLHIKLYYRFATTVRVASYLQRAPAAETPFGLSRHSCKLDAKVRKHSWHFRMVWCYSWLWFPFPDSSKVPRSQEAGVDAGISYRWDVFHSGSKITRPERSSLSA